MIANDGSSMRILAVDDDMLCRQLMQAFLQRLGYEHLVVGSSNEALAAVADASFQLVLLDLDLPLMRGPALLQSIRERYDNRGHPYVPAIVVSGHADAYTKRECLQSGFDGYLVKPILLSSLKSEIEQALHSMPPESLRSTAGCSTGYDFASAISELGIDIPILRLLLRSFFSYAPNDIARLRAAISERNHVDARLYAHKLKGSLGTLLAGEIVDTVRKLEEAAESRRDEQCERLFTGFSLQIERFTADAQAWLQNTD